MFSKLNSKRILIFFITVLIILWSSVLIFGGVIGPYAWWGLMIFGIVGMASFLFCIITIIKKAFRKHSIQMNMVYLIFISLFAMYRIEQFAHILW